jgi:glycosyltransferase involved in cell wall biosynthesis
MKSKPDNCIIWGERDDVDSFYSSMDLFYFASKGDRKVAEANPLVIREALSWGMKVLMYNMESYCGQYDNNPNIEFLEDDMDKNIVKIVNVLKPPRGSQNA